MLGFGAPGLDLRRLSVETPKYQEELLYMGSRSTWQQTSEASYTPLGIEGVDAHQIVRLV